MSERPTNLRLLSKIYFYAAVAVSSQIALINPTQSIGRSSLSKVSLHSKITFGLFKHRSTSVASLGFNILLFTAPDPMVLQRQHRQ